MKRDMLAVQKTIPLAAATTRSAANFRAFLHEHELCPLDLAVKSGIRYVTIWNITRGNPVRQEQAAIVRVCLWHLTGVWYDEPICVTCEVGR